MKILPLAPASRLVGREVELAALLHRLELARARSGSIGEPSLERGYLCVASDELWLHPLIVAPP